MDESQEVGNYRRRAILSKVYTRARRTLRHSINKAKTRSWRELIQTIDKDPWGLPYKVVLGKLRQTAPSLTETLESDVTEGLLDSLFPRGEPLEQESDDTELQWMDEWDISHREMMEAFKRTTRGNTAPGQDGFKKSVLKKTPEEMMQVVRGGYNACMRKGWFPSVWKKAILVLVPKGGDLREGIPKERRNSNMPLG